MAESIRPSKDRIYFSYWSWHLLKDCPLSYKLAVVDAQRTPEGKRDVGNAIQGSIPDQMATEYFNTPVDKRDVNFFLSDEEFERQWSGFVQKNTIDWVKQAVRYAKKQNVAVPDNAEEWALKQKKADTQLYTRNIVKLITALGLDKRRTQAQVDFKVVLEPAREEAGAIIPSLEIGGRIDLVAQDDESSVEDIWDLKAVEDPGRLDIDQLIIYRMGRKAQGHFPRTVGFLLAKQCKALVKKLTDSHDFVLKKLMRNARSYFVRNNWPGNYRNFWCPKYCDMREFCPLHKSRTAGLEEFNLEQAPSGSKVNF